MTFVLSPVCFDADRPAKCGSDSHTHTRTHTRPNAARFLLTPAEQRTSARIASSADVSGSRPARAKVRAPNAAAFWALSPRIYPLHPGLLTASLLKSLGQNSGHDRQEFLVPSHLRIFVYYWFFLLRFKATIR